jgi:hypothetical protein
MALPPADLGFGRAASQWRARARAECLAGAGPRDLRGLPVNRRMSMKVRTVADHLANVLWPHAHREKLALPRSRMEGNGIPNLHEEWSIIV